MENTANLGNSQGQTPWTTQNFQPNVLSSPVQQTPNTLPPTQTVPGSTTTAPLNDDMVWQDVITQAQSYESPLVANSSPSPYVTYSDQPSLTPSMVNDPLLANTSLQQLLNLSNNNLNQLFTTMNNFATSSLTPLPQQFAEVTVTNPEILQRAQQTGVPPETLMRNILSDQQGFFSEIVSQYPPDVANKLTFAQYSPQGSINLPPDLQKLLGQVQEQVRTALTVAYNLPSSFGISTSLLPDGTNFQAQLSVEYENGFSQQISEMVENGTITPQEEKTLMAMQGGMSQGTPHLKLLLANIQSNVQAQLQEKYGFSSSYELKPDLSFYNNVVNGDFSQAFQKNVAKYTGTANAEQKELLKQYAANPKDPSIPDSIKQLAQQIASEKQMLLQAYPDPDNSSLPDNLKEVANQLIEQTRVATIGKYGLDTTWQPTITSLLAPGVDPVAMATVGNALSNIKDITDVATNLVNGMPDSPEKNTFLSFLKVVGEAMNKMQNSIYSMQASQSDTAKMMSTAKMTSALDSLAKQQKAAEEAQKKAAKLASMGPIGKLFEWILKIFMVIISVVGGPAGIALALLYFVDSAISEATGKKSLVDQMFEEISKLLPAGAASVVKFFLAAFISVVAFNPIMAMNLIGKDSQFIQSAIEACGGDKSAQAMGAMIFNLVIQVAAIIVMMIVSGGGASGMLVSQLSAAASQALAISEATATTIIKTGTAVMNAILTSLQVAQGAVSLNNNILLSEMDIIKGSAESFSKLSEGFTQVMQKVVNLLLDLIQGNADNIATINKFQGQKWNDGSQLITQIAS